MSSKAYNIVATPLTAAVSAANANGKTKTTFRATATVGGRQIERTVVAQGKAAELIEGKIEVGTAIGLRVLFEKAPGQEEGKQGGEFLTVVALPLPKAA